jgi:hypothetical protein
VPAGFNFDTAGPHGAILEHRGELIERTRSGKRISLGRPYGNHQFVSAIANRKGLLAIGTDFRYMTFAHPHRYRVLDVEGTGMNCTALSGAAVGCYSDFDDQPELDHNEGIRSFSRSHPQVRLGRSSLGESQDAGVDEFGNDPYQDLHRDWVPVVSALGAAAIVNTARSRVVLAHDAIHTRLLFRVPKRDH